MKTTKFKLVKDHLLNDGSITSWFAFENFGATRLSDIIYKLRNDGWCINTVRIPFTDRFGNVSTYAKYEFVSQQIHKS